MHRARKTLGLCIMAVVIGILYAGYKVYTASRSLEQYCRTFGYRTPTTGLPDCVLDSPAWKGYVVDSSITYADGAHNIMPFDIDGDGTIELVANAFRSDSLAVYKHTWGLESPSRWTRLLIDSDVGGGLPRHPASTYVKSLLRRALAGSYTEGAHYTAIADLNGDGRNDMVVAGDLTRYDVVWYEAAGTAKSNTQSWKKHIAYQNDSHRTYFAQTGDIDGDGDVDIVFTTKSDRSLGWLENRGTPGAWPAVVVDSNSTRCFYARVLDANGDGRAEIIASEDDAPAGGRLWLYTHSGHPRDGADWSRYCIAHLPPGHGISVLAVTDLDADGDKDIAAASHEGDVYVLRNPWPADVYQPWEVRAVKGCTHQRHNFREIDVGDIDLDGDQDIVVADESLNAVIWFENPGTTFLEGWKEHVVDQSDVYLRWCHCARLGDVDKDGDLDIAVAAAASNVFLVYLNQAVPNDSARVAGVSSGVGENK